MQSLNFFRHCGLFIQENFLDVQTCAKIQDEMRSAVGKDGQIYSQREQTFVVDHEIRKVKSFQVSQATEGYVKDRLLKIRPTLENYFQVQLTGHRRPVFLFYEKGDFYRAHSDVGGLDSKVPHMASRKISIVIFLNAESSLPSSETYCGGALTFFGILNNSKWKPYGFPLKGEKGLLVAFRSEEIHEVLPVTSGVRSTLAVWFN
ncbi:MAG: 2OG-Fe(II) oxygenase [Chlamydiae bacterium]|nr:2OG-Fe(II) oxygenase [Chlamydiota bacterium]MBI3265577.1 2OG-Fe(II) oxygenase [Chlamydiota bacterium]